MDVVMGCIYFEKKKEKNERNFKLGGIAFS
jgi:hypothetical protein